MMSERFLRAGRCLWIAVALGLVSSAWGQGSNLSYQVANLIQDLRLLEERMRHMQMQVEEVARENEILRNELSTARAEMEVSATSAVSVTQLKNALAAVAAELSSRDEVVKKEVIALSKDMTALAASMEKALGTAQAGGSTAKPAPTFHTNFPKNGTTYIVQSGDTLASIAQKQKSSVDWIRNANQIVDPRALQVGQRLFIPLEKE